MNPRSLCSPLVLSENCVQAMREKPVGQYPQESEEKTFKRRETYEEESDKPHGPSKLQGLPAR